MRNRYRTSRTISHGIVVEKSVLIVSKDWTFMPTGKVRFYREDKGYGLIAPDDGGKAVFVHITSVADPSVEVFREDRRVRYIERVSQRSGNPEAFMTCH
jgi:cold shock protein